MRAARAARRRGRCAQVRAGSGGGAALGYRRYVPHALRAGGAGQRGPAELQGGDAGFPQGVEARALRARAPFEFTDLEREEILIHE